MAENRARREGRIPLPPVPLLSIQDQLTLNRYRKGAAKTAGALFGKLWNAPNTAIGLGYGLAGAAVGAAMGTRPRISLGGNAVQFRNNPFGGVSAITLGNTTIWNEDPGDPNSAIWNDPGGPRLEGHHTQQQHELQHTLQGEQLGPFYLPSNLLGGLYSLSKGHGWHGPENWNEIGPQMDPPRPWGGNAR